MSNDLTAPGNFEHSWRLAKMYASSVLIPAHLRDKPADVLITMQMATVLGENPVVVMQSIYVVSGRAGWSSQYVIARANASGKFRGGLRFKVEGQGDGLTATCYATLTETGETVDVSVSMATARAEGWDKNPKYRTMPEVMLRYRAAALFVRLYAPEVMLGYQTVEEVDTTVEAERATVTVLPRPALPERPTAVLDGILDTAESRDAEAEEGGAE